MDKTLVLRHLDIKQLYLDTLINLKIRGGKGLANCPFHNDSNPSLSVNVSSGMYCCHACGEKGDVFKFVMTQNKCNFITALRYLSVKAGLSDHTENARKCVAVYKYFDTNGKFLYEKQRWEPGKNGRSKDFIFKNRTGYGRGCDPVPYNTHKISAAETIANLNEV